MSKFQVGDRVEVVTAKPEDQEWIGSIGTVLSINGVWVEIDIPVRSICDDPGPNGCEQWYCECLKKIDDGHEQGSWSEIEKLTQWNPTTITEQA